MGRLMGRLNGRQGIPGAFVTWLDELLLAELFALPLKKFLGLPLEPPLEPPLE